MNDNFTKLGGKTYNNNLHLYSAFSLDSKRFEEKKKGKRKGRKVHYDWTQHISNNKIDFIDYTQLINGKRKKKYLEFKIRSDII